MLQYWRSGFVRHTGTRMLIVGHGNIRSDEYRVANDSPRWDKCAVLNVHGAADNHMLTDPDITADYGIIADHRTFANRHAMPDSAPVANDNRTVHKSILKVYVHIRHASQYTQPR
jgi:hypothetical protein